MLLPFHFDPILLLARWPMPSAILRIAGVAREASQLGCELPSWLVGELHLGALVLVAVSLPFPIPTALVERDVGMRVLLPELLAVGTFVLPLCALVASPTASLGTIPIALALAPSSSAGVLPPSLPLLP